jgi:hypothetical protein
LENKSEAVTVIKLIAAWRATHWAINVLPHPLGPYNNIPDDALIFIGRTGTSFDAVIDGNDDDDDDDDDDDVDCENHLRTMSRNRSLTLS